MKTLATLALAACIHTAPAVADAPARSVQAQSVAGMSTERFDTLAQAVNLRKLMEIVSREGINHAIDLEGELFPKAPGSTWTEQVLKIHDPERIYLMLRDEVMVSLSAAQVSGVASFMSYGAGKAFSDGELLSRKSMLDASTERRARAAAVAMRTSGDPKIALVDDLVSSLSYIDRNVGGGLTANLKFYEGLAESGAMKTTTSERELMALTYGQEAEMRKRVTSWIEAHLVLSMANMTTAEIESYIGFMKSPLGRAWSSALFDGYAEVFATVSYEIGYLAGAQLRSKGI